MKQMVVRSSSSITLLLCTLPKVPICDVDEVPCCLLRGVNATVANFIDDHVRLSQLPPSDSRKTPAKFKYVFLGFYENNVSLLQVHWSF